MSTPPPRPPPAPTPKTVLISNPTTHLGHALALAFVHAGHTTYGLTPHPSTRTPLNALEIISVLGSASSAPFVARLASQTRIGPFDVVVVVSCTEEGEQGEQGEQGQGSNYNDTIGMVRTLATASARQGVRPLVLFTSGSRDNGTSGLCGDEGLVARTEESPRDAAPFAAERAFFEHGDLFDAVVLRPTPLYGYDGGDYSALFEIAAEAAEKGVLVLRAEREGIVHGMHVDDCAAAYVAVAEAGRDVVRGQCYDVSSWRYETVGEVADALVRAYGISGGVEYLPVEAEEKVDDVMQMLFGFGRWVGSEKLRRDTGWRGRRRSFSGGVSVYRRAYEAAVKMKWGDAERIHGRLGMAEVTGGKGMVEATGGKETADATGINDIAEATKEKNLE